MISGIYRNRNPDAEGNFKMRKSVYKNNPINKVGIHMLIVWRKFSLKALKKLRNIYDSSFRTIFNVTEYSAVRELPIVITGRLQRTNKIFRIIRSKIFDRKDIILLSEPSITLFLILITSLSYFLKAADIPHNTHNFQKGRIPGALEILPPYIPLKEVLIYTPAESDIECPAV